MIGLGILRPLLICYLVLQPLSEFSTAVKYTQRVVLNLHARDGTQQSYNIQRGRTPYTLSRSAILKSASEQLYTYLESSEEPGLGMHA